MKKHPSVTKQMEGKIGMGKFRSLVLIAGICCVVIAGFVGFAVYGRITNISLPQVGTRVEIDSELLESSIRQIAELSTLTQRYTEVSFFEDQATVAIFGREINLPGTARSFILRFSGDIRFGVHVGDIRVRVVESDSGYGELVVYMPAASILTHAIDMESIQVLDERSGIFARLDLEDYTYFIAQQQRYIEGRESTRQLLAEAERGAEEAVYVLLRATLGDAGYSIAFARA